MTNLKLFKINKILKCNCLIIVYKNGVIAYNYLFTIIMCYNINILFYF